MVKKPADKSASSKTQIDSSKLTAVPLGTQLNGLYEIDQKIASGGMGEVYRGHNIHNDEPVAIKIVLPEFAKDETILALFRKEAKVLGRLTNDAIVRYHAFSIDPVLERPYLAMEFVDGTSLADERDKGAIPPELVRHGLIRIAGGMAAAHSHDVIHRDLTPDNVILPDRKMAHGKIIDFGIAKATEMTGGTVLGDRFAGKYSFVSPEQLVLGGEITGKTDIYSLGLVIASCLRGKDLDMGGDDIVEVNRARQSVPDLEGIDESFIPLLGRMLDPNTETRIESMEAVVKEAIEMGPLDDIVLSDTGLKSGAKSQNFTGSSVHSIPYSSLPASKTSKAKSNVENLSSKETEAPFSDDGQKSDKQSESPFGAYDGPENPVPNIPTKEPVEKKSSFPKFAAGLIFLLILGAGGGFYYQQNLSNLPATEINDDGNQEEVDRPVDIVQEARTWIDDYTQPACFHVSSKSISTDKVEFEFHTNDTKSIDDFKSKFAADNPMQIMSTDKILNDTQCGLTALLSVIPETRSIDDFQISVRKDIADVGELIIPDNEPISGELTQFTHPITQLLLLGDEGVVYDLGPFLKLKGDTASFSVQLKLEQGNVNPKDERIAPLVAIAINSPNGLKSGNLENITPAESFFGDLLKDLQKDTSDVSIDIQYFRLKGASQ